MKKRIFITGIIVVFLTIGSSCASTQQNKLTDDITKFWEYISENENIIFTANTSDQAIYNEIFTELNRQIQLVDKNLYIFMNVDIIDNKRDIIISSGGNSDYFELCDKIVKAAPVFVHINPVSLLPPTDKIEIYAIGDLVLNVEDIFVHFDGNEKADLLFILSNNHLSRLQNENSGQLYSAYMHALYLMTMQLLGERTFATKIGSAVIAPLPIVIMPIVPFKELLNHIH